ncbi:MAG TPA: hypothetical protein VF612_17535 [Jatrophihabitans sp.]|jgi:hypothetical protein|uniref:hypothetical protein n=1 Tax=Jatrophihabitans sp. TaxID=1932789 RepID=UPI002F192FFE
MAGRRGGSNRATYISWVTDKPGTEQPARRSAWDRLRVRFDDFSFLDAFFAALCVAVFDFVAVLVVSGWQSAECGDLCGLRTQLHLLHVSAVLTLTAVALPPLILAFVLRRGRVAAVAVQAVLCLVVVVNVVGTEHRLVPRINGTAPCWNPDYSPAECPWGPKD